MPRTVGAVRANLAEGLSYVRRTRAVLLAVTVVGLVATAGMNFSVVVPALSRDVLGTGAEGYGFLMAASGDRVADGGRRGRLPRPAGDAGPGRGRDGPRRRSRSPSAFSRSMPLSLVCMFGIGIGGIAMAITANTTMQLAVPDVLRGRVMSVYTTVFAGSTPIGGLAFGAIAGAAGAAAAIILGGALALAVGIGAAIVAWRWGMLGARGAGRGRPVATTLERGTSRPVAEVSPASAPSPGGDA